METWGMASQLNENFMQIIWENKCWQPPIDIPKDALDLINSKIEPVKFLQDLLEKELILCSFAIPGRDGRYIGFYYFFSKIQDGNFKYKLLEKKLDNEIVKLEKDWIATLEKLKLICGGELDWCPKPQDLRKIFNFELRLTNDQPV
jgi:hypothetical protein